MKRIVLVRHAKAVPYGYEDDFNRDLTDRGERDAGKVSEHLEVLGIRPDLMVASPASRAWQTAVIFAGKLGYPVNEIVKVEPLYMEFTTGEFIDYVRGLPDEALTVFVFGHNPGISYFAERLARNFFGDMPTCSTVGIDFGVDSWKEVDGRSGTVAFHWVPKGL